MPSDAVLPLDLTLPTTHVDVEIRDTLGHPRPTFCTRSFDWQLSQAFRVLPLTETEGLTVRLLPPPWPVVEGRVAVARLVRQASEATTPDSERKGAGCPACLGERPHWVAEIVDAPRRFEARQDAWGKWGVWDLRGGGFVGRGDGGFKHRSRWDDQATAERMAGVAELFAEDDDE